MPQALQPTSSYDRFVLLTTMRFFAIASVVFATAIGVFANPVVERQAPQSVAVVLTTLSNNVTPLANQLREYRTNSPIIPRSYHLVDDDRSLRYF